MMSRAWGRGEHTRRGSQMATGEGNGRAQKAVTTPQTGERERTRVRAERDRQTERESGTRDAGCARKRCAGVVSCKLAFSFKCLNARDARNYTRMKNLCNYTGLALLASII